jgi:ABC-type nitrate/sulfonate/bicarbonate transport system ATPase subunit
MSVVDTIRRGEVTIRDLSKSFAINGRHLAVLKGLNLDICPGECLVIVGASGSGKTTLLRVLAGLDRANGGVVRIDGRPVHGVGTECAVIFQEPRLLPWLTVLGNVAFGLEVRGEPKARAEERARRYIALVGLGDFADAYPGQLSGGMAQRVGIARALTVQPEILLLDEPLGALDAMTRIAMQEELSRIWREEGVTMVMVTHDLEEAVYLADRVLVLPKQKGGGSRLIAIDLPRPRERSESRFVRFREELLREFGLH